MKKQSDGQNVGDKLESKQNKPRTPTELSNDRNARNRQGVKPTTVDLNPADLDRYVKESNYLPPNVEIDSREHRRLRSLAFSAVVAPTNVCFVCKLRDVKA